VSYSDAVTGRHQGANPHPENSAVGLLVSKPLSNAPDGTLLHTSSKREEGGTTTITTTEGICPLLGKRVTVVSETFVPDSLSIERVGVAATGGGHPPAAATLRDERSRVFEEAFGRLPEPIASSTPNTSLISGGVESLGGSVRAVPTSDVGGRDRCYRDKERDGVLPLSLGADSTCELPTPKVITRSASLYSKLLKRKRQAVWDPNLSVNPDMGNIDKHANDKYNSRSRFFNKMNLERDEGMLLSLLDQPLLLYIRVKKLPRYPTTDVCRDHCWKIAQQYLREAEIELGELEPLALNQLQATVGIASKEKESNFLYDGGKVYNELHEGKLRGILSRFRKGGDAPAPTPISKTLRRELQHDLLATESHLRKLRIRVQENSSSPKSRLGSALRLFGQRLLQGVARAPDAQLLM